MVNHSLNPNMCCTLSYPGNHPGMAGHTEALDLTPLVRGNSGVHNELITTVGGMGHASLEAEEGVSHA